MLQQPVGCNNNNKCCSSSTAAATAATAAAGIAAAEGGDGLSLREKIHLTGPLVGQSVCVDDMCASVASRGREAAGQ